jgi:adenylate cyclase
MFTRLGVRGRLLLSFFGISAFAIIAAATAMYSFLEVGKALERIIEFRVPSAIASLQLSRQAERSSPRPRRSSPSPPRPNTSACPA